ncbi:hypothetical protein QBC47DRAFT_366986 [Echria macrotheca]|uniref:Prolyl 4-hydroxylase alpha subunit Fe(2+) 2OG dioxygenase domain-containing protein n=1 Tax=Echria macrotheca TaxID=438768 RepID=A0AAJ0FFX5_9PEZI|nr:hypothetical protein QBC47DRAFT_366986 [Echria macrotheca]
MLSSPWYPPTPEFVRQLSKALNAITTPGSFAAFREFPWSSMKPILVHDVGHIAGFPLQETVARDLIAKARQAPYGKGSETFVDTSVRNTWELDASQLELSPQWNSVIEDACAWAAKELGVTVPVRAELYKMLIYEKGAMFKAHTDTEKIPGMFGTLVVYLPSTHEGGDLVLKHGGVTKVFRALGTQPSMACWYSDVSHEVLPVTSGIRWVLTYNLAISQPPNQPSPILSTGPSAAGMSVAGLDSLRTALGAWVALPDGHDKPDYLFSLLDHTYTEANISLASLKGADSHRMRCLKDACDMHNVTLYFGLLEKVVKGACEPHFEWIQPRKRRRGKRNGKRYEDSDDDDWHDFSVELDSKLSIKPLLTADGRVVRKSLKLREYVLDRLLIQDCENPFEKAAQQETDYSGYTGNSGATAKHWYRMTVAVLVRNDAVGEFLTPGLSLEEAVHLLQDCLEQCSNLETRRTAVSIVCGLAPLVWGRKRNSRSHLSVYPPLNNFDINLASRFIQVMLENREYKLVSDAITWYGTQTREELFRLIAKRASQDPQCFNHIKDSLLQNILLRHVEDREQLVYALYLPVEPYQSQYRQWAANEVLPGVLCACSVPNAGEEHGGAIARMGSRLGGMGYVKMTVIPLIQEKILSTPFALEAVLALLSYANTGLLDKQTTLELCYPLLKSVLEAMSPSTLLGKKAEEYRAAKQGQQSYRGGFSYVRSEYREALSATRFIYPALLAKGLNYCIQFGWDELVRLFALKVTANIKDIPPGEFGDLWVAFVRELMPALEEANLLSLPRYRELACAILEAYLDKYVGMEQAGVKPVSCDCPDCTDLNRFLASAETEWLLNADIQRTEHVEEKIRQSAQAGIKVAPESVGQNSRALLVKKPRGAEGWVERFKEAMFEFREFHQERLKVLLGSAMTRLPTCVGFV